MKPDKKPFFFRIDLIDLMDFATEPEGCNMTILEFAKELKKGESVHPPIQKIINETKSYMEMAKERGRAGGLAKAAKELLKHT
jgi:hypothetical protein